MNSTTDTKRNYFTNTIALFIFIPDNLFLIPMSPCIYLTECKEKEVKTLFSLLTMSFR